MTDDLEIAAVAPDDPELKALLEPVFGEALERAGTRAGRPVEALAARGAEGLLGGALFRVDEESLHLWLMAVGPSARRRGVGRALLAALETVARERRCVALSVHTYRQWEAMRALLLTQGWALTGASAGRHHDGVAERWIKPLRDSPLRVILVGAHPSGRGAKLANALNARPELARLVGVVDNDEAVREHWKAKHVPADADVDALLDQVRADAALLAVPHHAYAPIRERCFARELGVLQEKPLACSMTELLTLQRQLADRPRPLVVGVQRRAHGSYVFLRQVIASATDAPDTGAPAKSAPDTMVVSMGLGLGDAESQAGWRGEHALAGGGVLLDMGYHAIDLVHFILGAPLDLLSVQLWSGARPVLLPAESGLGAGDTRRPSREGEVETAATLYGRAGRTWVRVEVDRTAPKGETVWVARGSERWEASRSGVWCDGEPRFQCSEAWDAALEGMLASLVVACSLPPRAITLWDHLATLQVVERAYASARAAGLGRERSFG